jgi:hypothetical protein
VTRDCGLCRGPENSRPGMPGADRTETGWLVLGTEEFHAGCWQRAIQVRDKGALLHRLGVGDCPVCDDAIARDDPLAPQLIRQSYAHLECWLGERDTERTAIAGGHGL